MRGKKFLLPPHPIQLPPPSFALGAKFGLEPGEVSVSFPVAALDTRSRAALLPQTLTRPRSRLAAFWGGCEQAREHPTLSPVTPPAAVPTGSAPGQAEQPNVPRKLLHETQPGPTNYQGFQKPHFPLRPRVFDPNVIEDGVFLSDVSPSNIGRALPGFQGTETDQVSTDRLMLWLRSESLWLYGTGGIVGDGPFSFLNLIPAEKKKGRSATFYPLDNTPFLLPVDETQPPVFTSSMEPVGVSTEMALLSNILAAYAFITENPERAALYFVSGVCIGLVLTLLALVLRVSCRTDCKRSSAKKPPRERESDSDSSDSDDDSDTTSDLSARRHRRFERTLNMNVFTSAEELERAQRLEERERIIREIWMNGQPDIPGTRSLNRYY
uniref:EVA1 domain-containing protein n=1 Tax=Anser cygnoides TaxID=8845 RepID=A0A8B9ING2_ANSCY|nr:protein eva-1 homolog A isoform X8 [Anser cygnoides]